MERRKKIAFLCAVMMLASVLSAFPGVEPVEASSKTTLMEKKIGVEINGNSYDRFGILISNAKAGKTYTATVSDDSVAEIIGYSFSNYFSYGDFEFWAKKKGKVKITVKEKGRKKIGTAAVTIKKSSDYYKSGDTNYLKKKITSDGWGVSLEVVKIKSIKRRGRKSTVVVQLDHPVTKDEYKLANGYYHIDLYDKKENYVDAIGGQLKKGSDTFTGTSTRLKLNKYYYSYGFSRANKAGYSFKVKCKKA